MKPIYIIAASLSCCVALSASAQNKFDLTSQQRLMTEYATPAARLMTLDKAGDTSLPSALRVFVTLDDASDISELTAIGIEPECVVGRRIVATVTPAQVDAMQTLDCVVRLSLTKPMRFDNDLMRQATNVDMIRQDPSFTTTYDGSGTIVALYDSGMQPNHPNFVTESGTPRVKVLYVYEPGTGPLNDPGIREKEYTTVSQIKEFTTENREGTHGTHVLGIAAGSYVDDVADYSGVAPGAELAVACGWTDDGAILTGLSRLIQYAEMQGKPIVINLSLGDIMGPHDGTDSFAAALDELAATTPLVISSGNSGDLGLALVKQLDPAGDNQVRTVLGGNDALAALNKPLRGQKWDAQGTYEIYASDANPYDLKVGFVDVNTGELQYYVPLDEKGIGHITTSGLPSGTYSEYLDQYYKDSYIIVSSGISDNNRYYTTINLSLLKKAPFNNNIIPAIIVTGAESGQRIDLHTNSSVNLFSDNGIEGWDAATTDGSNNNLTCGRNVIGAGAYTTRIVAPYEFGEVGTVAPFSGSGTLIDGTTRPHVCAPGHALISSLSTYFRQSQQYSSKSFPIARDLERDGMHYYWTPMSGTSMAAPVVTGTLALWRQANPDLTPAELRAIAMETAQAPETPSVRWGAGKIDAYAGLKRAIELLSVGNVSADMAADYLVQRQGDIFNITNAASADFDINVYNMSGVAVATAHSVNGQGSVSVYALPAGIYILRAGEYTQRIIR